MALEVIERKEKRIHVRARDKYFNPCIGGLSIRGMELEFWIDEDAPIPVLNKYKTWNFSDGSSALGAGTPITKTGAGELKLSVEKADIGRTYKRSFVPQNDSEGNRSFCRSGSCNQTFTSKKGLKYNGGQYLKRSRFHGDRVHDRCLSVQGVLDDAKLFRRGSGGGVTRAHSAYSQTRNGSLASQTPLFTKDGISGRKRRTPKVFFRSKKGIKYGKKYYKFPPMQIYKRGKTKEIGNKCFKIRGKLRDWKKSAREPMEKYRATAYWKDRRPIVGSPIFYSSKASMGVVKSGLPKWIKGMSDKEKLICKPTEIVSGQKKVPICIQEKHLVVRKKKEVFSAQKKARISMGVMVNTKSCDAKTIQSKLENNKRLIRSIQHQRHLGGTASLSFTLTFTGSGAVLSFVTTQSSLINGERRLTDIIKRIGFGQKACSADIDLEFKIKSAGK